MLFYKRNIKTNIIDNWKYDYEKLPGWIEKSSLSRNLLYENHDFDMACLLYGIQEISMCHEVGNLAIFQIK